MISNKKILKSGSWLIIALSFLVAWNVFVQAQSGLQLARLSIQIWPEFDRPETLVIYQGELADTVALPVSLTFRLPAGIETMNAVAVSGETGSLLNNPYTLEPDGDVSLLTFTIERPGFQFEYYDPAIVTIDAPKRLFNYQTVTDYPVANLQFEVQQPLGAEDMQLSLPSDDIQVRSDQMTYYIFRQLDLSAGTTVTLSGDYQKETNTLTAEAKANASLPFETFDTTLTNATEQPWFFSPGSILVILGVSLLLVSGGVWFFSYRRPPVTTRRPARKKMKTKPARPTQSMGSSRPDKSAPQSSQSGQGKFCHQCGVAYKPHARFCHNCGTERR